MGALLCLEAACSLCYRAAVELLVASLNYSSWSGRALMALRHAGFDPVLRHVELGVSETWKTEIETWSGAGKVPVLRDNDLTIHDSLAICEYAAELNPSAKLWPESAKQRAQARALSAEMHSGFHALRDTLPTNVRLRVKGYRPAGDTAKDIARVQTIWREALAASGGPFLFGDISIADFMYAPVATRFRTYDVAVDATSAAYMQRLFDAPSVRHWLDLAPTAAAIPAYDAIALARGSAEPRDAR